MKSSLQRIWYGMRQRCYNPKNPGYRYWGGRGITICEQWKRSFAAFQYWANRHGYSNGLTIHRIDPSKGYEPGNCRWVTRSENSKAVRPAKVKRLKVELFKPATIVRIRKFLGWSQQDLANRIGVSRHAVENWEQGIRYPGGASIQVLMELKRDVVR